MYLEPLGRQLDFPLLTLNPKPPLIVGLKAVRASGFRFWGRQSCSDLSKHVGKVLGGLQSAVDRGQAFCGV